MVASRWWWRASAVGLSAAMGLVAAAPTAGAAQPEVTTVSCIPSVEGPITVSPTSEPYRGISLALPSDWLDEEYFISCSSPTLSYKTAVWVRRPADPRQASGVAIVEALHPAGAFGVRVNAENHIFDRGHVEVGVAATAIALETRVKPSNPDRYASLNVPATPEAQNEILAGVGALLHRRPDALAPGVRITDTILGGFSATGVVVRNFIASPQVEATVDGKQVFDGFLPGQSAVGSSGQGQLGAIPDVGVPVVEIQGERELLVNIAVYGGVGYRRADGKTYRLYEVPGMPHTPAYPGAECVWPPGAETLVFDQASAWETSLDNLVRWAKKDVPAPRAARIEMEPDGTTVARDEHGNARGGMRNLDVEVPTATLTSTSLNTSGVFGSPCAFVGYQVPFDDATLTSLYRDHDGYIRQVEETANRLVRQHWLVPEQAREAIAAAEQSEVLDPAS